MSRIQQLLSPGAIFRPFNCRKITLLFLIFAASHSKAQIKSYSFSSTTGNTLETGGFTNLLGTFLDDDVSAITSIPFTFQYSGINYTNFSVTSNGLMRLGGAAVTDYENLTVNLTGSYLIPYWDDNYTDADGSVRYKVMGAAGSRKLVVEYNLAYLGNTGTADKHFQVWLFETTNKIMFVYGAGNNLNGGYTIGILTNGTNDFISVTTATHTSSILTAQNNNTTWPGSGRAYQFTTGSTLPVTLLNFNGKNEGSRNVLAWITTTEVNNRGFELQRTADGTTFTTIDFISTLAADGNSNNPLTYYYTDNIVSGSKYYYRLRQVDIDGRGYFSPVIVLEDKPVSTRLIGIAPNPVIGNRVQLQITSPVRQALAITFYDLTGKVWLQRNLMADAGNNSLSLDIGQLAKNMYLLKVTDGLGNKCGSGQLFVAK